MQNISNEISRNVPLTAKIKALFSGRSAQYGWFLAGFSMIFFWAFGIRSDISSLVVFSAHKPIATTHCSIVSIEDTGCSERIHGISSNIYRAVYHYNVNGRAYTGNSYFTVESDANSIKRRVDNLSISHCVEYRIDNPALSRIQGTRRAPFAPSMAAMILLPLASIVWVYTRVRHGMYYIRLLRSGERSSGRLISKRLTMRGYKDQTIYCILYEFGGSDGKLHTTRVFATQGRTCEVILYDPRKPSKGIAPALEASAITVDETGKVIEPDSPARAILLLIIPLIVSTGVILPFILCR